VQKFDMERLNLKRTNDVEAKEQYQLTISNRIAALKNLDDDEVGISSTWESIRQNIKLSVTDSLI
jgi:hypothetical protein